MNYGQLVPKGTFIADYLEYMAEQETAAAYDYWGSLWLLSSAVGRHCVVGRPRAPVYLNMYLVLVAESGITRKSSAVRQAARIARELYSDDATIGMIENKISAGHLDYVLHDRTMELGCAQMSLVISELATFLGSQSGSGPMPALLTDLYDCPASRRGGGTITGGTIMQRDVWLSFMSASTPSWLFKSVNPTVIEGGFTSRCLFVVSEKPKGRIAWPDAAVADHDFVQRLRAIRAKAKQVGQIVLNDGALKEFRSWYARRPMHVDPFRSSFEAREDAHVLRVAALLSINDDMWVVTKKHISDAIRIIMSVKQDAYGLFNTVSNRGKWVLGIEHIRATLLQAGSDSVPRSKLYLKCRRHLNNDEFAAVLDTMHESGMVERFELRHDTAGRPVDLYKATKLLHARGVIEQLTEAMS